MSTEIAKLAINVTNDNDAIAVTLTPRGGECPGV